MCSVLTTHDIRQVVFKPINYQISILKDTKIHYPTNYVNLCISPSPLVLIELGFDKSYPNQADP